MGTRMSGLFCGLGTFVFFLYFTKGSSMPEDRNIVSVMKTDSELCEMPSYLYDSNITKICTSVKYSEENFKQIFNSPYIFLCLAFYDTVYKVCQSRQFQWPFNDMDTFYSYMQKFSTGDQEVDKIAFCENIKDVSFMYKKIQPFLFVVPLKTRQTCLNTCYNMIGKFQPLCAVLAWSKNIDDSKKANAGEQDTLKDVLSEEKTSAKIVQKNLSSPGSDLYESTVQKVLTENDNNSDKTTKNNNGESNIIVNTPENVNDKSSVDSTKQKNANDKSTGATTKQENANDKSSVDSTKQKNANDKSTGATTKQENANDKSTGAATKQENANDKSKESLLLQSKVTDTNVDKDVETTNLNNPSSQKGLKTSENPSASAVDNTIVEDTKDTNDNTKSNIISEHTQDHDNSANQDDWSHVEDENMPDDPNNGVDQPMDTGVQNQIMPEPSEQRDSIPHFHSIRPDEESHFFTYFTIVSLLSVAAYIGYHNKQKILAIVLEGRRSRNSRGRRRPSTANYRKLDCTLEEAVTSQCNANVTHVIY